MSAGPGERRSGPLWRPHEPPPREALAIAGPPPQDQDLDPSLVPPGRGLISGLLGLNVVLLGAALVTGQLFKAGGHQNQEARVFLLLLLGASVAWMLWYLLWARRQPHTSPHQDHHAGGAAATTVLLLFAVLGVLLCVCMMGYVMMTRGCKPLPRVVSPFIEAPFLGLQAYLLWCHSKDCVHRHKVVTRSGLILLLSTDVLLWLNAVTEDTVHEEIELEKQESASGSEGSAVSDSCGCGANSACLAFRKGVEVLYPFAMEFYLMAGCMVYVMWRNVGRRVGPGQRHHGARRLTLDLLRRARALWGLVAGALVLLVGLVLFLLYQLWVGRRPLRQLAFLLLYALHLAVVPVMGLCCLAGLLVHRLERHAARGGHNPTRSLDVALLVATASGPLALSYFSLVAVMSVGPQGPLASLDLSYSVLTLLELLLQNAFIIEGLHRHPEKRQRRKTESSRETWEDRPEGTGLEGDAAVRVHDGKKPWAQRIIKEICAFLLLSNVMMWVIPAFGVHPQFENGFGKAFFGFSAWFVLVNLSQPLSVFYRMHSVAALMELLIAE